MKKETKEIVLITSVLSSILAYETSYADDFIRYTISDTNELPVNSERECVTVSLKDNCSSNTDIVIRVGEYPDKPGKRLILNKPEYYNGLDVHYNSNDDNYYISEYYFNERLSNALYSYLKANGVNVKLQDTLSKKGDLNSAGRIAKQSNPTIYLSIHTNSYASDSRGYLFVTNNDKLSKDVATRLSNSMKDNNMIPQRDNIINNGYIGELNEKPGTINILAELGFFSNPNEAQILSSDDYVSYMAKHMGDEIIKILESVK